jgi:hypothetical protein
MKLRSILATLALVTVPTLGFLRPTEAQSMQEPGPPFDPYSACIQECLEQYVENVKDCKKAAKVCDFWLLWTCFASHTHSDILDKCLDTADAALSACLAGCAPQG